MGGCVCITSIEPVLWLRISGDLLWMVIGSDRGTARSVSSLERSSRLPGSVCFCPFWMSTEEEGMRVLLSEQTHGQHATKWHYLLSYLCRRRSEAKASWCILLLLHAFYTWAEMKLNVETLIWGEVLLQEFELITVITSLQIEQVETVIQKHFLEFWIWNYKKSFRCYIITALYLLCHVSLLKPDNSLVVFETRLASLWWFMFNFSVHYYTDMELSNILSRLFHCY